MSFSDELALVETPIEGPAHDVRYTPAIQQQDDTLAVPLRQAPCVVGIQQLPNLQPHPQVRRRHVRLHVNNLQIDLRAPLRCYSNVYAVSGSKKNL